jgi:hypothetical protein
MNDSVPNPGSKEAQELGCTCPVIDNHNGKGFLSDGELAFWYAENCPVHVEPKGKFQQRKLLTN